MTLATTERRISYLCNGASNIFGFPYPFFAADDLRVRLLNANHSLFDPQPALNGSGAYDFTLSGDIDGPTGEYLSGASLIFNSDLPAGLELVILRHVDRTQELSLRDNSRFPAKSAEAELDRLTMLTQDLKGLLDYTLSVPELEDEPAHNLPRAELRANKVFGFDADGQPEMLDPTTLGGGGGGPFDMNNQVGIAGSYTVTGADNLCYREFDTSTADGVIVFDPSDGSIPDATHVWFRKTSANHDLFVTTDGVKANAVHVERGLKKFDVRKVGSSLVL